MSPFEKPPEKKHHNAGSPSFPPPEATAPTFEEIEKYRKAYANSPRRGPGTGIPEDIDKPRK